MNEVQNKKTYTLKVVLITLLVVLLVGCISFIVYDKFIKKDNKENNPQTSEKDNMKNDSQIENKDDLTNNEEQYELIDINADADFDSFKVTLNACLGCGTGWNFAFDTETTAIYNDRIIKFPKPIKYWAWSWISSYLLLSDEGDLYSFDMSTKKVDLILSDKSVIAMGVGKDESGNEVTIFKTTSGNKKIVLK